jgi:hypothetical protein
MGPNSFSKVDRLETVSSKNMYSTSSTIVSHLLSTIYTFRQYSFKVLQYCAIRYTVTNSPSIIYRNFKQFILPSTVEWAKSERVIHFDMKLKLVLDVFVRFFLQKSLYEKLYF